MPEVAQPAELVETIRRVADGEDQLLTELTTRPDLVGRIVEEVRHSLALDAPPENPLSARETEILSIVACGFKNREIAIRLDLSQQTVKNHVTAILHKLGASNRTRAVMYAVRQGWIELPEADAVEADYPPTLRLISTWG